ncbi:Signal transduction histidine kinase [Paenimyroides ummariense]|uniref:histidine kinase n=1 Tax=Paenimyroides ummariense TaxID=913024 RepID=A0A1I5DRW7_9FLAO|nr:HAMP domain-containing sensor histidine kinase [Paenimyroides ummariense]SFO02002.1 Signal transduction histidine kinase [Paenimyroides ummariense]
MKLLNKSLLHLSLWMFMIIGVWSVFFYFNMLNEIKESVDEGLENYKRQIIYSVEKDPSLLKKTNFDEGFFAIRELSEEKSLRGKDTYIDTLMYMQDADDQELELEPVRLLATAFKSNDRFYELKIINSMVEEDDLVKELFREALVLYLVLIAAIIFINSFILKRLWKPFYLLLNQLKDYRVGSSDKLPQAPTNTKEFNDLQQAVTILLQRTIETYRQQKEFIGNASHELQTPLAIATNKLELFVEKAGLNAEQAGNISEVLDIIGRMVRLNKSLLLLTKIENRQFFNNRPVSLNKVVHQSIGDLEELAAFRNIEISVQETAEMLVTADNALAQIVVSNLLRNAVFHNINYGSVAVFITEKSIQVVNTGIAQALDHQKLFSRFYKSEGHSQGSGLGLAIVKAVCDLYGFSLQYHYDEKKHIFEVKSS